MIDAVKKRADDWISRKGKFGAKSGKFGGKGKEGYLTKLWDQEQSGE